jgi:hypothetical protein
MIALPSADRRGKGRAERPDQQSEKQPQQEMRGRFARRIRG